MLCRWLWGLESAIKEFTCSSIDLKCRGVNVKVIVLDILGQSWSLALFGKKKEEEDRNALLLSIFFKLYWTSNLNFWSSINTLFRKPSMDTTLTLLSWSIVKFLTIFGWGVNISRGKEGGLWCLSQWWSLCFNFWELSNCICIQEFDLSYKRRKNIQWKWCELKKKKKKKIVFLVCYYSIDIIKAIAVGNFSSSVGWLDAWTFTLLVSVRFPTL